MPRDLPQTETAMRRFQKVFALSLLAVMGLGVSRASAQRVKVACVGNSITYGFKLENRECDAYPAQLQRMLGEGYEVGNFGHSGATLLRRGHRPYVREQAFRDAVRFAADIVVIHLGINDTDPRNWPNYGDEFVRDYLALIDSLRQGNPQARVIVARMTPIADRHPRFQSGTKEWHGQIQRAIETVAARSGAELIDFHAPLYPYPWMLHDAVHPDAEGAALLARMVCSAITGNYGGLQLPITFSDYMVLQRRQPLTLRGKADAGTAVALEIRSGRHPSRIVVRRETTADNRGEWAVVLPAMEAADSLTLTVTATPADRRCKPERRVFTDVAIGEVWLCSGQSNMARRLDQSDGWQEAVRHAADSGLRLFDMKERWPTDDVEWPASAIDSVKHLLYYKAAAWQPATPQTAQQFSAVAYYFGRTLRDSLRVPVGLICNAVGGATAESWIDRNTLETRFPKILERWLHNDFIQEWARGRAARNLGLAGGGDGSDDFRHRHPYEPCFLFEAGILPLERYPVRGIAWYQGESNAHNVEAHERLFRLLVQSWRQYWDAPTLPFRFVQLSSLNRPSWPAFRDSQRRLAEEIPATGMVVTSDVGDSLDVHYLRKRPVGERLARLVLARDYGRPLLPGGPRFRSAAYEGGEVLLIFDDADGLTTSDGRPPRTFEVAEDDGLFYPASARIEGRQVRLCLPREVNRPRFVRYGWQPFTRANLVNSAGLPASTFRGRVE